MKFKNGVKVSGIRPEIAIAMYTVDEIFYEVVGHGCTVTSVTDGRHGKSSRHYIGLAFDVRIRDDHKTVYWDSSITSELVRRIKIALTDEYDVVLEKTHIHIEFDPK